MALDQTHEAPDIFYPMVVHTLTNKLETLRAEDRPIDSTNRRPGLRRQVAGAALGHSRSWAALGVLLIVGWAAVIRAEVIHVPNASFESPATTFVDTRVDLWQKAPKPAWFDESGGHYWDQLIGVFQNTAPGSSDHIDNLDGTQAIFLFALPEVALFQDFSSLKSTNAALSLPFDARFEVGKTYQLSVGVTGGGGIPDGSTLQMSLYYRDAQSNRVTVATNTITYTAAAFTNATHLLDQALASAVVKATDPWAAQYIGIQFLATPDFAAAGGYWDLDNVRLSSEAEGPRVLAGGYETGQFTLALRSPPGSKIEILGLADLATSPLGWNSLGTVTNLTGSTTFIDKTADSTQRFYRARQVP